MKKLQFIIPFLLISSLLILAASAAGGNSDDPLISRDFLRGSFLGDLLSSIDKKLDTSGDAALAAAKDDWAKAVSAVQPSSAAADTPYRSSFAEVRLKKGDQLSGVIGTQVIPVAGELTVSFSSGAVVDVSAGTEISSGSTLKSNHRYLVAEDTKASFTVSSKTAVINYCGSYAFTYSASPDYNAMAGALKSLNLFRGTDTAYGSGYDLEVVPARIQAVIMLIRMLGEEGQALACTGSHPFVDVPQWCDRYVAYAYEKGYSNGVGKDRYGKDLFGTDMDSSAVQYTEFVLRALGYSSTATTDISDALERARKSNVITAGEQTQLQSGPFLRADAVYLSYYALNVPRKGSSQQLHTVLSQAGVFTDSQYRDAQKAVTSPRIV